MNERKVAEGRECMKNAEKCMKTSFFKWSQDVDGAISEYQKAAVAFKNGKAYEQAIAAYLKCAEVQHQGGARFHAAKSYESAAMIYKDMKQLLKVGEMIERASDLYLEHGTPDTAAICLERGGKILEYDMPDKAIYLYRKASDVAEANDNMRQCAEETGKLGRILMRQRKFDEAIKALRREIELYNQVGSEGLNNKLMFGLVLLYLHQDDYVAADQAFKRAGNINGFSGSEEAAAIEQLLEAYEQGDGDTCRAVLNSPLFRFMENDFVKLARSLRLPDGGGAGAPSVATGGGDDDDYSGGLL